VVNMRNGAYIECKHLIKNEVSTIGTEEKEEKERRQSWALPIKVPIIDNYRTYIFLSDLPVTDKLSDFKIQINGQKSVLGLDYRTQQ
jgi:hypothetical protein